MSIFDEPEDTFYLWANQKEGRSTEKAYGVEGGGQVEYSPGKFRPELIWLPKSHTTRKPTAHPERFDYIIPEWLMKAKDLEDEVEEYTDLDTVAKLDDWRKR